MSKSRRGRVLDKGIHGNNGPGYKASGRKKRSSRTRKPMKGRGLNR